MLKALSLNKIELSPVFSRCAVGTLGLSADSQNFSICATTNDFFCKVRLDLVWLRIQ
jgi:hypothetical protein